MFYLTKTPRTPHLVKQLLRRVVVPENTGTTGHPFLAQSCPEALNIIFVDQPMALSEHVELGSC